MVTLWASQVCAIYTEEAARDSCLGASQYGGGLLVRLRCLVGCVQLSAEAFRVVHPHAWLVVPGIWAVIRVLMGHASASLTNKSVTTRIIADDLAQIAQSYIARSKHHRSPVVQTFLNHVLTYTRGHAW